ncbi:hypothetical protein [Streptomyces sp. AC495_CC817]|uniref:hypothetical protein n=1 Tax=Streptomyces sp. AC495_CC817 TaxID=2823900 RepID=UPI001C280078|nr:hypothetical protein [Streptomyces sp. AC495_CC817]
MTTRTEYELIGDRDLMSLQSIADGYNYAQRCAEAASNDEEIQALQDLVDSLLSYAGITVHEVEVEECDECDDEATNFWPELKEPVQLCASCTHNARRSGWEPGQ